MKQLNRKAVLGIFLFVLFAVILSYVGLKTAEYKIDVTENSAISIPFSSKNTTVWWNVFESLDDKPVMMNDPAFSLESIDLSFLDFDSYNVILTQGYKLNKLVRTKKEKFPFMPYENNACTAHFSSRYYPDTVFVYLVDKKDSVNCDAKLDPKTTYVIDQEK
jgi:hypothetical protein